MTYRLILLLAALALVAVPANAQFQERGERAAQARLPQGKTILWATLRQTKIGVNEARGMFTAAFPPPVKALNGQTVKLQGFMIPLDAAHTGTHFLLSKYTPVCDFCPPGEPNEVVEVHTARPIRFVPQLVTINGKFSLMNNGEKGLFFQLSSASVL